MSDFLLRPAANSRKKAKRVGRGPGSGQGCTSGKGSNGQLARSGAKHRPWFEGGQMPLQRRLPKGGFRNVFRDEYEIINVEQLEVLENGAVVTNELLYEAGLIKSKTGLVKILGDGTLTKKLSVTTNGASGSAQKKIAAVGGSFTKIEKKKFVRPKAVRAKKQGK
jgi:large subunit ribosomal protein L15